jgi:hypothetical protein
MVSKVVFVISEKKVPGPDSIGSSLICLLWEWYSTRITGLVRMSIRLGAYPKLWKITKGVTIPKLGKDDYSKVKSYRVISLLNCLGEVVEKVVAIMLTDHCEWHGTFYPRQYGCSRNRSAVDARRHEAGNRWPEHSAWTLRQLSRALQRIAWHVK